MAFVDRRPPRNRAAIIGTVAVLHGLLGYALVTGLVHKYTEVLIELPDAYNIPKEVPPPPPDETVKPDPVMPDVTVPKEKLVDIPVPNDSFKVPQIPDVILPQIPDVTDLVPAVIPEPVPTPLFKPVSPKPRSNPGTWVSTSDYPTRDIRQGNEGTARFLLDIGADGRVKDCRITQSTGHPGLDAATCEKVSSRARFNPGKNDQGEVVSGTYSGSIRWVIPE